MSFDEIQKELLKPLDEKGAVVYFPFFANTFPLGYHYYQFNHSKNLKFHDWATQPIPDELVKMLKRTKDKSKKNNRQFVFYATEKTIKDFKNKFKPNESNIIFSCEFISEYIPRLFFFHTSRHTFLRVLVNENKNRNNFLQYLHGYLNSKCDVIEIYTDIPIQAGILKTQFEQVLSGKQIKIIRDWTDYFDFPNSGKKVIRIYFYGAPVTSALSKRQEEFTPVSFPEVRDKSELNTYICAGKVVDSESSESELISLKNTLQNLSDYHKNLFNSAKDKFTDLRNVWWTYNRYALSHQHNSLFKSPQDYAECLRLHHRLNSEA
ncbi:MAG: hypothetical protein M3209_17495 [Acidobacteriota bacterium]|nr:hypothetical protein [Acidobacteriota bacterium]